MADEDRIRKRFPVFDCDAHINDPDEIWSEYVEPQYRDVVRRAYWKDAHQTVLNGRTVVIGGASSDFPGYNPICIAGPQMTKQIARRLQQAPLTPEQKRYLEQQGAYDPRARLREMDLMGIDQVMIIPTMMVANFPFVESVEGASAFARAYNSWARDYCAAAPERLFPAGWLPLQSVHDTCRELERIAGLGFRAALIRPIDARGRYPNFIFPNATWLPSLLEHWDRLFKLYRNERALKTERLPSEAFRAQCFIAFESDEKPVFRQWDFFADWGVWSSDTYHHDGSDSWSAIREMQAAAVPEDVQGKLLGGNARRMYGVESRLFVTDEPPPLERPDWFPGGEELAEWARVEADPRAHGITSFELSKLDPRLLMQALRPY